MRVETYIEAHTAAAVEASRANSVLAMMQWHRLPEKMITSMSAYADRKSRQAHKFAQKYGDDIRLLRSWAEDWGSP